MLERRLAEIRAKNEARGPEETARAKAAAKVAHDAKTGGSSEVGDLEAKLARVTAKAAEATNFPDPTVCSDHDCCCNINGLPIRVDMAHFAQSNLCQDAKPYPTGGTSWMRYPECDFSGTPQNPSGRYPGCGRCRHKFKH